MNPTDEEIDRTLDQLSRTRMEIIDEWVSDAEREGLPTVNLVDTGAPLLDRDEVLRRSCPNYARVK